MAFLKEVEHLQIPLTEIASATNNFDEKNFIALGGYGKVYHGQSEQYGTIAVKRLYVGSQQGQHEFTMEIALLSTYKHENLVSLVGFCDQDGEKILVYKHESNGSLDKVLQRKDLNWIQRLQICLDAARGLKYLHDDVGPQHRVLHRDVKSSNILLDENWRAKISDFGLSKISPANVRFTFLISNACGTIGYVDPQYVKTGILTQKSDIFSFGVVLFEVLCGRPARVLEYEDERQFLHILARKHYEKETLSEIINPDLQQQLNSVSLGIFSSIAYQCLKKRREERPTMRQIEEKLQNALDEQLASSGLWHDPALRHKPSTSRSIASSLSSFCSTPGFPSRSRTYKVCISCIDHDFGYYLSSTLQEKGITAYVDDETLDLGESSPSILKSIKESKLILIIFSKDYAYSVECLNRLEYVMQRKDEIGQIVMPIFLNVDPLDVRNQLGEFGKAFTTHKSNINKAESWRKALTDAASIAGWHWTEHENIKNWPEFIKVTLQTISKGYITLSMLEPINNQNIDWLNIRMEALKSLLGIGNGGVRMVGICGIWGSGKSTLASSIYSNICDEFEGCCFIENVSAETRMYGLKKLQEKIISNVLKRRKMVCWSMGGGISKMKRRLRSTRVLIVLDEVDHIDHLKTLAGSQDWFGVGSRIIIITRNRDLLNAHNIDVIYDVRLLNVDEAFQIFGWHALNKAIPFEAFKLSLKLVSKLGGHPVALASLGSFLRDKDMEVWIHTLARLEDFPVNEVQDLFRTHDDGVPKYTKFLAMVFEGDGGRI